MRCLPIAALGVALSAVPAGAALASGTVHGTVVDGTVNDRPLAGIQVLLRSGDSPPRVIARTRTDARGAYRFAVARDTARNDTLLATYQGFSYSQPVSTTTTLRVFQITRSDAQIVSASETLFISLADGYWNLFASRQLVNLGAKTYVGTLGQAESPATIRITLPPRNDAFRPIHGFATQGIHRRGDVIFDTTALEPSVPGFSTGLGYIYAYRFRYTGNDLPLHLVFDYPTTALCVAETNLVDLQAPTLQRGSADKSCSLAGGRLRFFSGHTFPGRGTVVSLLLKPARTHEIGDNLAAQPGVRAASVLTALAVLCGAIRAARRRPSTVVKAGGEEMLLHDPQRRALVAQIAALDEEREIGSLSDSEYSARRRELVARALAATP